MDQNNHNIKETNFNGKSYLVYMDLIMLTLKMPIRCLIRLLHAIGDFYGMHGIAEVLWYILS
jgi:hypothetical protein